MCTHSSDGCSSFPVWNNIRPAIVTFLEKVKAARLERERRALFEKRLKIFDAALPAIYRYQPGEPSALDIALGIPAVREKITAPQDVVIDTSSFDFLHEALPAWSMQWKAKAKARYTRLLEYELGELPLDVDLSSLAVATMLNCTSCSWTHSFPQVLSHECQYDRFHRYYDDDPEGPHLDDDALCHKKAKLHLKHRMWDSEKAGTRYAPYLAAIVRVCGFDPKRATTEEMHNSSVRLGCKKCKKHGMVVMSWLGAVRLVQLPFFAVLLTVPC